MSKELEKVLESSSMAKGDGWKWSGNLSYRINIGYIFLCFFRKVFEMGTISEAVLFRLEKFGGILINKTNFDWVELDETEAFFLYLVQNHGFEIAVSFFKKDIEAGKLKRALSLDIYSDKNIEGIIERSCRYFKKCEGACSKIKKA